MRRNIGFCVQGTSWLLTRAVAPWPPDVQYHFHGRPKPNVVAPSLIFLSYIYDLAGESWIQCKWEDNAQILLMTTERVMGHLPGGCSLNLGAGWGLLLTAVRASERLVFTLKPQTMTLSNILRGRTLARVNFYLKYGKQPTYHGFAVMWKGISSIKTADKKADLPAKGHQDIVKGNIINPIPHD